LKPKTLNIKSKFIHYILMCVLLVASSLSAEAANTKTAEEVEINSKEYVLFTNSRKNISFIPKNKPHSSAQFESSEFINKIFSFSNDKKLFVWFCQRLHYD